MLAYQQIRGPLGPQRWDIYVGLIIQAIKGYGSYERFMPHWQPEPKVDYAGFYASKMAEFEAAKQ